MWKIAQHFQHKKRFRLVTQQAILRKFWHAVMPLSALADGPQPFTLVGENIVAFLDASANPAALRDRCCHCTAKLSKGWWVDSQGKACKQGNIQCGYHGWTYAPSGQVINIPQFEASRAIMLDYKTTAYHATVRYGYAWVALEEPIADIPDVPEFAYPAYRTIFQFYERWQTSPCVRWKIRLTTRTSVLYAAPPSAWRPVPTSSEI